MPITMKDLEDRRRVVEHTMTYYAETPDLVLCSRLRDDLEILALAIEALEARTRD